MISHTFSFQGTYKISDLADYLGKLLGIKLIAKKPNDEVHGYLSQTIKLDKKYPNGYTVLTVNFYDYEEAPNWDEETKNGHQSHIKPYLADENDYLKIQEALNKVFIGKTKKVKKMTKKEIDKLVGSRP